MQLPWKKSFCKNEYIMGHKSAVDHGGMSRLTSDPGVLLFSSTCIMVIGRMHKSNGFDGIYVFSNG